MRIAIDYQNDGIMVAREDLVNITIKGTVNEGEEIPSRVSSIDVEHNDATLMKSQSGRTAIIHPSFAQVAVDENGVNALFRNRMAIVQKEGCFIIKMVQNEELILD